MIEHREGGHLHVWRLFFLLRYLVVRKNAFRAVSVRIRWFTVSILLLLSLSNSLVLLCFNWPLLVTAAPNLGRSWLVAIFGVRMLFEAFRTRPLRWDSLLYDELHLVFLSFFLICGLTLFIFTWGQLSAIHHQCLAAFGLINLLEIVLLDHRCRPVTLRPLAEIFFLSQYFYKSLRKFTLLGTGLYGSLRKVRWSFPQTASVMLFKLNFFMVILSRFKNFRGCWRVNQLVDLLDRFDYGRDLFRPFFNHVNFAPHASIDLASIVVSASFQELDLKRSRPLR